MNTTLATATLTAALGLALSAPAHAQEKGGMRPMTTEQRLTAERMNRNNLEACYGVAARGKNDCADGAHGCAGTSTQDRDKTAFLLVPKGDCQKIAGGSLKPS